MMSTGHLQVVMQGYRVVHDDRAGPYDRLPDRVRDEVPPQGRCPSVGTSSFSFGFLRFSSLGGIRSGGSSFRYKLARLLVRLGLAERQRGCGRPGRTAPIAACS